MTSRIRLGEGKSFWVDGELIDLTQLYYDWCTSGRGDWGIHYGWGLYGYLVRTYNLIEKFGSDHEEGYADIILREYRELVKILADPSYAHQIGG